MLTALYIHIPFCKQICTYCDFHKEIASFDKKKRYIKALKKEIIDNKESLQNLKTIFIGGGTPSSLEIELQKELFKTISEHINLDGVIEYSIETNPNDITEELCQLWKSASINRVSIGVQTFNDKHLSFLNRIHREEDIKKAITLCKRNGLKNISIDLIFSLIGQTKEEVTYDLQKFFDLDIDHLSYYSLILEEKTTLMYLYDQDKFDLNSEDLESELYEYIMDELKKNGYTQYEISNFQRNRKESKHNKVYWSNKDYLGLGSGSHSLINGKRIMNVASVKKYSDNVLNNRSYQEEYERDEFSEECIMGLRLLDGINVKDINEKYNIDLFNKIPELNKFIKEEYLELQEDMLKFTRKGLMIGNIIFGLFIGGN